jgi:hypothetical protein
MRLPWRNDDEEGLEPVIRFDPWLACSHPAASALADTLFAYNAASHAVGLKRTIRQEHRANFAIIVKALVANLAMAVVRGDEPCAVAFVMGESRGRLSRYGRKGFTALADIVLRLEGVGVFTLRRSTRKGHPSTLIPSEGFKHTIRQAGCGLEHFGEEMGREAIILRRSVMGRSGDIEIAERIEYPETPESTRLRGEMHRINRLLAGVRLSVAGDEVGQGAVFTGRRHLERCFVTAPGDTAERFDLGGGLSNQWWQGVHRAGRRILIEGEPVAELHVDAMALRLAYVMAGVEPASGDLFAGLPPSLSEPRWRAGVLSAVDAMLMRSSPLLRLPKATMALLPPNATGPAVRRAILAAHPALSGIFERGHGLGIEKTASNIMVAALGDLAELSTAALPITGGVLVPRSTADRAAAMFRDASARVCGKALPLTLAAVTY